MHRVLFVAILALALNSCMVGAFTAATTTGVALAKNRTVGDAVDDAATLTKIHKDFIKEGLRRFSTRISVEVSQGRVLYTGSVDSEEDMIKAVEIAWRQKGVKEVINELVLDTVGGRNRALQYVKDTYVTAAVKSKLMASRKVQAVNYTVITHQGIVYLIGVGRSEEELQEAADIASRTSGVEKVVSHVRLSGQEKRREVSEEPFKD